MTDLAKLKAELTDDPLSRGYSGMDDSNAAASLNAVDRDADTSMQDVYDYLVANRYMTSQGTDVTSASNGTILGRLLLASKSTSFPADPFGAGDIPASRTINLRELCSVLSFLDMVQSGVVTGARLTDSEHGNILNDLINGGIMSAADRTAIIALSQNKQSRASELSIGRVTSGAVAHARSM